jgi:AAHS family 4-hydroxybenzoate transporter-like MFS transporter
MYLALPLGGVIGGPISAVLIARYGWQAVFILGGVLPLLLTVALLLWLTESIRFLVLSKASTEEIGNILHRVAPSFRPESSDVYVLPQSRNIALKPMREIFSREFLRATALLCIAAFAAQVVIVYVVIWMPLILTSIGLDVTRGILTSVTFTAGGVVGTIGLARFIDKNKSYQALVSTFMLSAISIASVGFFASNWYWLLAIVFISGLPTIGAQIVLYAYSATIYPASIRSTGVGWVVGSGRVGAIGGSLLGTALAALGLTIQSAYVVAAVPAIVAGLAIALIRMTKQQD